MRQYIQGRQQGFLLIIAVVLIVIVGVFASSLTFMFTGGSRAVSNDLAAKQAFYLAESGLERGAFALLSPHVTSSDSLTKRYLCSGLNLGPASLGEGAFTVASVDDQLYAPSPAAGLNSAVSASDTLIPMTSLSGYAAVQSLLVNAFIKVFNERRIIIKNGSRTG